MKALKVLCIGDLHFQDVQIPFYELFITRLHKIVKKGKYDYVILLGDVKNKFKHDTRQVQTLVNKLVETITLYSKLYILVGNHDFDSNQEFLTENHTLTAYKKWPNVQVVDTVIRETWGDHIIILTPFVPKGRFHEALDTHRWKDADVVFAHQEILGCKMGVTESIDGDGWSEDYPLLISGHIHEKQKIGSNVIYPGTPYDTGWSSGNRHYMMELELSVDSIKPVYIEVEMPKKVLYNMTYENAIKWEIPEDENSYKLKISCSQKEFLQIKEKFKGLGVKLVHEQVNDNKLQQFLKDKKITHSDYKTIFEKLVENEDCTVQKLFKKVLRN